MASFLSNEEKILGVSRRDFLKFCTLMAGTLALPTKEIERIAEALQQVKKPPAIYLEFQDCAGNIELVLRASHPPVSDILLNLVSLNYQETAMYVAGSAADAARKQTIQEGGYLLFVEGSVPLAEDGIYCCIGGRTAVDLLKESAANAAAVVAMGNCACWGNVPAINPNPTGAVGIGGLVDKPVVNMAGCPLNAVNFAALITYYLTYKRLPELDRLGRPLFGYGARIHDGCQRRAYFDAGLYVEQWGDDGHKQGWCLYKMGCKGPSTFHNCPLALWNERTSWPVGASVGCIGCSEVHFFERLFPAYTPIPSVSGFGAEIRAEEVAAGVLGVTAALVAVHAVGSGIRGSSTSQTSAETTDETTEEG